jgi:aarF domain-containing kinase
VSVLEFDDVFSSFDDVPLGIASIGQVHRAVLRETGEVVAVKIQMPDIETWFRSDISTITSFCQLALPQFVPTFAEIEKQFCTEFDYEGEAKNLNAIRDLVLPKWSHAVCIPEPHMELCGQHILVMEFLDGVKLVDGIRSQYKIVADATGQSFENIEKERVAAVKAGLFHFQTLEESQREHETVQSQLFWRDMATTLNVLRLVNNWTPLRFVFGQRELYETPTPLDLARIMQLLSDVHAYEIFQCGCFNGDPVSGGRLSCLVLCCFVLFCVVLSYCLHY